MLVPEHLVKQWFRPTSRVFKNFTYLFQNPLWNKPLPKGFTVCPYFWLAMFSMCLFRPIIVPFCLLIGWLLKLGGKPFAAADRGVRKFLPEPFASQNGTGLGALVVTPIVILLILAIIGGGCSILAEIESFRGKVSYIDGLGFVALAIASLIYYKTNESNGKRVRVLPILFGYIGASVLLHGFLYLDGVWAMLTGLFNGGTWVVSTIAWVIWNALTWGPFWNIPWWLDAGVIFGVTYLVAEKLFDVEYNPTEEARDYSHAWQSFFVNELNSYREQISRHAASMVEDDPRVSSVIEENYSGNALQQICEIITRNEISSIAWKLAERLAKVPYKGVDGLYEDRSNYSSFECHLMSVGESIKLDYNTEAANQVSAELRGIGFVGLRNTIADRFVTEDEYHQKFLEANRRWKEAQQRRKEWDAKLDRFFERAFGWTIPIGRMFGVLTKCVVTFFAYLWMLIVASKKGACPYFRFEETPQEDYYK